MAIETYETLYGHLFDWAAGLLPAWNSVPGGQGYVYEQRPNYPFLQFSLIGLDRMAEEFVRPTDSTDAYTLQDYLLMVEAQAFNKPTLGNQSPVHALLTLRQDLLNPDTLLSFRQKNMAVFEPENVQDISDYLTTNLEARARIVLRFGVRMTASLPNLLTIESVILDGPSGQVTVQ